MKGSESLLESLVSRAAFYNSDIINAKEEIKEWKTQKLSGVTVPGTRSQAVTTTVTTASHGG